MEKLKNIDFKNPTHETLFSLCMGEIITRNELLEKMNLHHLKNEESNIKIDYDEFEKLLEKYELQNYSQLIINHQRRWFAKKESTNRQKEEFHVQYIKDVEHKLKITNILKMLFLRKIGVKNLIISFKIRDRINLDDNHILDQLQETFLNEFERLKLNETELTRDEAIEELRELKDNDWINEYTDGNFFDGYQVHIDLVPEEIIKWYMETHFRPREVTITIIDEVIKDLQLVLNSKKEGAGARIKNLYVGRLAVQLSYLHRINIFLHNEEYNTVDKMPFSNDTCRFVYEYFLVWGLLNEFVLFDEVEKMKRANYVKALIRKYQSFSKREKNSFYNSLIDSKLEFRINLFKMVRSERVSPEYFFDNLFPAQ